MTRTVLKGKWGAAAILLLGAVAFGLGLWARVSLHPGPTALERLIARNAPAENVQALTARQTGAAEYLVGTSLGVIHGAGRQWTRLPGPETAVRSIAALADGTILVAGHGTGIAQYLEQGLMPVLPGDADAIAVTPAGRLYAIMNGQRVVSSGDGGKTWTQAASLEGGEQMLALAAGEASVAVGGLQGSIFISPDGGKTWESRPAPGGSVTALLFDPSKSGRLWACAGGAVLYSDDGGTTWRRAAQAKAANRPLVTLSPAPAGQKGIRAVSADGLLVTIGD